MLATIKRSAIALLAAPIGVLAAPVTVTTHSAGIIDLNSATLGYAYSVMNVLGLDPPTSTGPLPYELTLHAHLDTDIMVSPQSFWAHAEGVQAVVDFRVGAQAFHYAGPANSTVNLYELSAGVSDYGHSVWFRMPGYIYGFHHQMLGPPARMGIYNPLAPLYADQDDGLAGSAAITFNPDATDVQDAFTIYGGGPVMSVQVAAIPEPSPLALLATGLLTLGLLRRAGRAPRPFRPLRRAPGWAPRA